MARSYRLSAASRADLDEIWLYIAQDSFDAADRFIGLLISKLPLLVSSPLLGRAREELGVGLRSFPVKNYVVFYRVEAELVEVVRVVSAARDLESLFE